MLLHPIHCNCMENSDQLFHLKCILLSSRKERQIFHRWVNWSFNANYSYKKKGKIIDIECFSHFFLCHVKWVLLLIERFTKLGSVLSVSLCLYFLFHPTLCPDVYLIPSSITQLFHSYLSVACGGGGGCIPCNASTQGQHICCLTSLLRDIKEKNCFLIVGSICNRPHSSSHVSPRSQQGRLSPLWNPTHQSRWTLIWITACFESNSKQG